MTLPHDSGDYDARRALADAATSRNAIADRLVTPWWYHVSLGAILAALAVVVAIPMPLAVMVALEAVACVGLWVLVASYKRLTGLWVTLASAGPRTRRAWAVLAVPMFVAMGLLVGFRGQVPWALALVVAAAIFAGTVWQGRRVDDTLRAEIRSGAATATPAR